MRPKRKSKAAAAAAPAAAGKPGVHCRGKLCDPSKPLPNERWEGFCQDVMGGMNESDAFRKQYNVAHQKAKSVHENASKLFAKVRPRIEWLQEQTVDDAIEAKKTWLRRIRQLAFETDDTKRDALVGKCIEMFGKHYKFLTDKIEHSASEDGTTFGFVITKPGEQGANKAGE
jgi:hypothetical protein